MFWTSEKSYYKGYLRSFRKKQLSDNRRKREKILESQLHLLRSLENKSMKTDKRLLNELAHRSSREDALLDKLGALNKEQKNILQESMDEEVNRLRSSFAGLISVIKEQYTLNRTRSIAQEMFDKEKKILDNIDKDLEKEAELQKNLKEKIKEVSKLEHSRWFVRLIRFGGKVLIKGKYNIIEDGYENVPKDGPVVIAPRHFSGDFDPSLFYTLIQRRVFFLAATDWMKKGVEATVNKYIFKKLGAIPINRPDSIFEHANTNLLSAYKSIVRYLMLGQAIVVFPEGWPNIDSHYTPKKENDEEIEIRLGLFHFVDYVQKKKKIKVPIIPVGTKYVDHKRFRSDIIVNFGRPMYLPAKFDYAKYQALLQKEIKRLSHIE